MGERSGPRLEQLFGRAALSVGWINRHLASFTPWEDRAQVSVTGGQALGELAFLAAHVAEWRRSDWPIYQATGAEMDAAYSLWLEHIAAQIEDAIYLEMCRKRVAEAWQWLFPYLCLRASGYRREAYEQIIRRRLADGYFHAPERAPYRTIEVEYILQKAGFAIHEPDWHDLIARGSLLRWPDPVHLPDDAVYALTHTLMYATDLGTAPAALSPRERRDVVAMTECLIVHYVRQAFWDLLGELLTAASVLGAQARPLVAIGAEAMNDAWRNDGSVPGRADRGMPIDEPSSKQLPTGTWDECYHTTLVWLMFVATYTHRHGGRYQKS